MDVFGIIQCYSIQRILTYTRTFTDFIHVFQCILTRCSIIVGLINGLGIIQIGSCQTIQEHLTPFVTTILRIILRIYFFTNQITILGGIVCIVIISLILKEFKFTPCQSIPRTIIAHCRIKTWFSVTIHIICTFGSYFSLLPCSASPVGRPSFYFCRETFFYIF